MLLCSVLFTASCGEPETMGVLAPDTETSPVTEIVTVETTGNASGEKSMPEKIAELAEKYKDDPVRFDAAVYALAEGIDVDEAVRRLALMDDAGELQAVIKENEEAYAGSWIQHQPEYKLVYAFTENGEEIMKKYLSENSSLWSNIKILDFGYSYAELQIIGESLTAAMDAKGAYSDTRIQMKSNRIDMYFFDKETAERVIRQDGIDIPDCVQILQFEGLEIPDDLLTEEEKNLTQAIRDGLTWSQWWAVSINETDVITDTMVTMFLRQDGEITGSSGCNWYGCRYNQKGRYIRISGSDITSMGCAEDILDQEESFLACLQDSYSFKVEGDTLVLYDVSGKVLVVCERLPRHSEDPEQLIGTNWRLVSVDGEEVTDNESGMIFFDPDGFSLHGEDAVFTYEYGYEAKGNVILFIGTRTTCKRVSEGEFTHGQSSVLRSLYPAVDFHTTGEKLELYAAGKITLVFERVEER